ncbi:uncharacterized protein LOC123013601 [Tribolium madens]|uniref:uncharacterized protein LOC123013601 n=1 Tax=Tribolium madens TaxID=41895 RepID=UPI001CF732FF|nr:uncharacterized protein LOC123013601 [Tribolium madens]
MAPLQEPKFTKTDCAKIISAKLQTENFTLVNFKEETFDKIRGFLGDHTTLTITIKSNGNEENHRFFVKSLPQVYSQRNFVLEVNAFFKEKGFFTKYCEFLKQFSIYQLLDDIIPTCRLIKDDSFVFEDLSTKGYVTFPSRESLTLDCVKVAVASLAKLHASGLILEEKTLSTLNQKLEKELAEAFYSNSESVKASMEAFKTGAYAVIDLSHKPTMKISNEWFKQKLSEVLDLQKLYAAPSRKFRNTICHGDVWTGNFMFKLDQKPKTCVLVDFQACRYGPPAQDVITFLYLTTNRDFRGKHQEEVLGFYYKQLDSILDQFGFKNLITKEEFDESCRFYKRYAMVQAVLLFQIVIMSEEVASELFANQDKVLSVLFKEKYDFMMEVCQKDPIFKKMNFEAIAELREFFEDQI